MHGMAQCLSALLAGILVCPMTNARVVEIAAAFGFTIGVLVYVAASFSGAPQGRANLNYCISWLFQAKKYLEPSKV